MTEIIIFPDPVSKAIRYLRPYLPLGGHLSMVVPKDWKWDELLVTVTDTGGGGPRAVVLDDVWLTVDVSHPDSVKASETARKIFGLLRAWPGREKGVYYGSTIARPTLTPDEQTRTPAYSMTVSMTFRGNTTTVTTV